MGDRSKHTRVLVSKIYAAVVPLLALILMLSENASSQVRCESIFKTTRASLSSGAFFRQYKAGSSPIYSSEVKRLVQLFGRNGSVPSENSKRKISLNQRLEFATLAHNILVAAKIETIDFKLGSENYAIIRSRRKELFAIVDQLSGDTTRAFAYDDGLRLISASMEIMSVYNQAVSFRGGVPGFLKEPITIASLRKNYFFKLGSENHNGILVPTDEPLTIVDFNHLVGSGIFPVGIVYSSVMADGRQFSPSEFLGHDIAHTRLMPGRLEGNSLKTWKSMLAWADSSPEPLFSIRHSILFYLSHEEPVLRDRLDPSSPVGGGIFGGVYSRLKQEGFWDRSALVNVPNLEFTVENEVMIFRRQFLPNE